MRRAWQRGSTFGAAFALSALVALSCASEDTNAVASGAAGAAGAATTSAGGSAGKPWEFGEPLISERGNFWIDNHDSRLIVGTWEALRIEEHADDFALPFSIEFLDSEGVSVEIVEGQPPRFHAEKPGPARVLFQAKDSDRTIEDAFSFEVEEPRSITMGACDQVLGGMGTDVRFRLNERSAFPQGLLPVEVSPSDAAQVKPIEGYLASEFQLLVSGGFVGTLELRSTLADGSSITLRAVDPLELEPPRIFGKGNVAVGRPFTVAVEAWTAAGVICSPVPITLAQSEGSACRVLRLLPASFYSPFERPKYELVGDVVGGTCELIAQYDEAALEAILGTEQYAALPAQVRAPVTIKLEIEIVTAPPPGSTVDNGGGSDIWD